MKMEPSILANSISLSEMAPDCSQSPMAPSILASGEITITTVKASTSTPMDSDTRESYKTGRRQASERCTTAMAVITKVVGRTDSGTV